MDDRDDDRIHAPLDRMADDLPDSAGAFIRWLARPSSRWARIPAGLLLVVAGVFGFLPILGLWMIPLGFFLLAQEIPVLRRPTIRAMLWLKRRWIQRKGPRGST